MKSFDVNESLSPHKYSDDYAFDVSLTEIQNKRNARRYFLCDLIFALTTYYCQNKGNPRFSTTINCLRLID